MKNINFFREFFQRYPHLKFQKNSIKHSFELLNRHLKNKNFLFIIGNGGSASDSDHIAGELLKGFKLTRSLKKKNQLSLGLNLFKNIQNALSVIPLTNFNAFNTAFGNDCNFDYTFAQLV
ncbi:hypothetical protein E5P55_00605 [Candidatus Pinguicoccus supinus]|uniref:Phosphoheptose isomerase n=1 Tax=Candidatus Pinguicoccus supinus TaxID=2529394 RepID=A0A7T0FY26_9BACT|nr:hypothetical protein E5P55_00605 [Candidatus Pinguicoccus supinus]